MKSNSIRPHTFVFSVLLSSATVLTCSCSKTPDVISVPDDGLVSSAIEAPTTPFLAPTLPEQNDAALSTSVGNVNNFKPSGEELVLFNGVNLEGWTNETGGDPKGWVAKDGTLCLVDPENGGDILTKDSFDNYIFSFEWRFGLECNSGVKYKIEQPNGRGWIGPEYQVQDDAHVEDGSIDKRRIASLFDVFPASVSSKADDYPAPETAEPSGKFRSGKIIVAGNHVEHWLDGERVLEYDVDSDAWNSAKAESKFKNQKNFGKVASSPLLLQCHGYPVEYRNLKIQKLSAEDK